MSSIVRRALNQESRNSRLDPLEIDLALESSVLDLMSVNYDIQMEQFRLEELNHAYESMQKIESSISLQLEQDERGLDIYSAQGYRHAISAILGDDIQSPILSNESFNSETRAYYSTQQSLEGVGTFLRSIWDNIVSGIDKLNEMVSGFIDNLEKATKKLEDKRKVLKDRQGNLDSEKPWDGSMEIPKPGTLFILEKGSEINNNIVNTGIERVEQLIASGQKEFFEATQEYFETLDEYYQKGLKGMDFDTFVDNTEGKLNEKIEQIKQNLQSLEMPGGYKILFEQKENEFTGSSVVVSYELFRDESIDPSNDVDTTGSTPTIDEIGQSLSSDKIDNIFSYLDEVKTLHNDLKEKVNNARKSAEQKIVSKDHLDLNQGEGEDQWDKAKVRWVLSRTQRNFSSMISQIDNYVFAYLRAVLDYYEKAVSMHEEYTTDEDDSADKGEEGVDDGSGGGEEDVGDNADEGEEEEGENKLESHSVESKSSKRSIIDLYR